MSDAEAGLGPSAAVVSFAEQLNSLFASVTYLDAKGRPREYSTQFVAKTISDDPDHETNMSRVYLATLRSGSNNNPTIAVVRALAKFFDERRPRGAPPITGAYLLGDDASDEERLLRQKLEDRQVRAIAMRAGSMTPALRRQLLRMLDVLDEPDEGESDTSGLT